MRNAGIKIQPYLSKETYEIFKEERTKMESVTRHRLPETVVINKIILEWKELKQGRSTT